MSGGPSAVNGTTTREWLLQWDVIRIIHRQGGNVKQPLSELRIGGYLLGFNDSFTAYKTTMRTGEVSSEIFH